MPWRFEYVWPEKYLTALETGLVLTAEIKRNQDIPVVLRFMNMLFPLPELKHLKRVCRKASSSDVNQRESAAQILVKFASAEHLEGHTVSFTKILQDVSIPDSESLSKLLYDFLSVHRVSLGLPLTKAQLIQSQELWPTSTVYPVVCLDSHRLNPSLQEIHSNHLDILTGNTREDEGVPIACCMNNQVIIVDPVRNCTVYNSRCETLNFRNSLCHPVMIAITHIASNQLTSTGKKSSSERDIPSSLEDESYLCTGYVVYILREPCVMCSMALVHARIGCVIFLQDSPTDGALKSVFKLQGVKNLNHHFEVWQAH